MAPRKSLSAIFFRKSYALPFASFQAVYWLCFPQIGLVPGGSAPSSLLKLEGSTAPYSIDFWY